MKKRKQTLLTIFLFALFVSEDAMAQNQNFGKKPIYCNCFDGIGSYKNDTAVMIFTFDDDQSVSVCGFVDKEMKEEGLIISEFNVFDCETGEKYIEFGALEICRIVEKQNELEIQELEYLPTGINWSWELIQIGEQNISSHNGKIVVSELKPQLQAFSINKTNATNFLDSLTTGTKFNL
jgi:hypothetical protein